MTTPETTRTVGGVIFCYDREARGIASKALRSLRVPSISYYSSGSLRCPQDPRPTPRYVFHGLPTGSVDALEDALYGHTEVYFDRE